MKRGLVFGLTALVSICLFSLANAENLNETSVSCSAPEIQTAISGSKITFPVAADDPRTNNWNPLSDCYFDILENTASETSATLTGHCSGTPTTMEFNWQTSVNDTGTFHVIFSFKDTCAKIGSCTSEVELIPDNCIFAKIGETFGSPGTKIKLPIEIYNPSIEIGGFTLCIEYDTILMTFIALERGEFFNLPAPITGTYQWHYLIWRKQPSIVPNKFQLCIMGIAKLYQYAGNYLARGGKGVVHLEFKLADNGQNSSLFAPVIWKTVDSSCTFNTFVNRLGDKLFVSNDSLYYNPKICVPSPHSSILNCVKFNNGGVSFKRK